MLSWFLHHLIIRIVPKPLLKITLPSPIGRAKRRTSPSPVMSRVWKAPDKEPWFSVFRQHVGLDFNSYIYDGEKTTTTLRRRKHRTTLDLFGTCGINIDDMMHDIYIYLQYQLMQRKESYQTFLEHFCTHQLFVLDPVTFLSPRSDFQKKEFLATPGNGNSRWISNHGHLRMRTHPWRLL